MRLTNTAIASASSNLTTNNRSNPYGQGFRLQVPGHLSPWCKMQMGWITPVEITNDGTYTLRASELYEDYFMISQPFEAEGEYLLIENRQPLLFDARLWQPGTFVFFFFSFMVDISYSIVSRW